jgi:hypothetical protein
VGQRLTERELRADDLPKDKDSQSKGYCQTSTEQIRLEIVFHHLFVK